MTARLILLGTFLTTALLTTIGLTTALQAAPRLAILELEHPKGVPAKTARYLGDLMRGRLVAEVPGWRVMTRENLVALLPPGVDLAACEGDCVVSTARNVGADAVISGEIVAIDDALRLIIKLHATRDSALLATAIAKGPTTSALEARLPTLIQPLVNALRSRPAPQTGPGQQRIDFSGLKDGDYPKGYGGLRVYDALRDTVLGAPREGVWQTRIPLRFTGDFALTLHMTGNTRGQQARCTRLQLEGAAPVVAEVCPHPDDRWTFGFKGETAGTLRAAHDQIMPVRIVRTAGALRLILDDRMLASRSAPAGAYTGLIIKTRTGPPMRNGRVDGFALEAITVGQPR